MRTRSGLVWPVFFLCSSMAMGATTVNERKPVDPKGNIEVEVVSGSVKVLAWDQPEVEITGTLGDGIEKLVFDASGKMTRISVQYPKDRKARKQDGQAHLVIKLPKDSQLEVDAVSANVEVTGVLGRVEVEAVSGDVLVREGGSQLEVEAVSGDVDAVASVPMSDARVSAVSGNLGLKGALAAGGRVKMEVVSGDVKLVLPESTSAMVELETFSGSLSCDLASGAPEGKPSKSKEQAFKLGDGDGRISVTSFSGDVRLEK